jgi:hypothetical protein
MRTEMFGGFVDEVEANHKGRIDEAIVEEVKVKYG